MCICGCGSNEAANTEVHTKSRSDVSLSKAYTRTKEYCFKQMARSCEIFLGSAEKNYLKT